MLTHLGLDCNTANEGPHDLLALRVIESVFKSLSDLAEQVGAQRVILTVGLRLRELGVWD